MILKLSVPYTLIELRAFVLDNAPAKIEMSPAQLAWYKSLLNQRITVPQMTYRGIPVKEYELTTNG